MDLTLLSLNIKVFEFELSLSCFTRPLPPPFRHHSTTKHNCVEEWAKTGPHTQGPVRQAASRDAYRDAYRLPVEKLRQVPPPAEGTERASSSSSSSSSGSIQWSTNHKRFGINHSVMVGTLSVAVFVLNSFRHFEGSERSNVARFAGR